MLTPETEKMKALMQAMPLIGLIVIAGCGDDGKPAKAEESVVKTQTDALKKAKKADQTVLDAAAKQREAIEKSAE
jgi:hypothetical protein